MKSKKSGREIVRFTVRWECKGSHKLHFPPTVDGYGSALRNAAHHLVDNSRVVAVVRKDHAARVKEATARALTDHGPTLQRLADYERGAVKERAAIVAWLRESESTSWTRKTALQIERGDHHRTRNGSGALESALTCTPEERATLDTLAWCEERNAHIERRYSYEGEERWHVWMRTVSDTASFGPTLTAAVASLRGKLGE